MKSNLNSWRALIKDYYEVKSKLINTLRATYLARGSVGNFYRYRSEEILSVLRKFLPKRDYLVVLDVGCGAGWYLKELEKGNYAVGVDFCREYLLIAKLLCKSADLVQADACNLPFRNFSVDFVLCSELIEHLLNPDEALKEIARVLRKGSLMLVTTPMKYSINEILGRRNHRYNIEHLNVLTYSQFLSKISKYARVIFEKAILFIPSTIFTAFLYYNIAIIRGIDNILSKIIPLRSFSWCLIIVAIKNS